MAPMIIRALLIFAFTLLADLTWSIPTGLNVMPTAETLGVGTVRLDAESDGGGKLFASSDGFLYGCEVGVLPGIEAGIDAFAGGDLMGNIKWRSFPDHAATPTYAVGVQGLRTGQRPQYFFVVTKPLLSEAILFGRYGKRFATTRDEQLAVKVHGGLLCNFEGDPLFLVGAESKFGPAYLQSDLVIGGSQNRFSLGIGAEIHSGLTVQLTGYAVSHSPDEVTLSASYQFARF